MSAFYLNSTSFALPVIRNLNQNQALIGKSIQRLASGLRINQAADDAAGLAISNKLTSQIQGLNQAGRNAQDGINLVQTIDGGFNEVTNSLQRIRELIIQAANDTNTDADRLHIQQEINPLIAGIDHTANSTEFNTRKILKSGNVRADSMQLNFQDITPSPPNPPLTGPSFVSDFTGGSKLVTEHNFGNGQITKINPDGTTSIFYATGDDCAGMLVDKDYNVYVSSSGLIRKLNMNGNLIWQVNTGMANAGMAISPVDEKLYFGTWFGTGVYRLEDNLSFTQIETGCWTYNIDFTRDGTLYFPDWATGTIYKRTVDGVTTTVADGFNSPMGVNIDKIDNMYVFEGGGTNRVTKFTPKGKQTELFEFPNMWMGCLDANTDNWYITTQYNTNQIFKVRFPDPVVENKDNLTFQVGANEGQTVSMEAANVTAAALNLEYLDVSTPGINISEAFVKVDNALDKLLAERAKFGALQNRLESTVNTLNINSENLNASNSRIQDADVAAETSVLVKAQIVSQASTAVLAQTMNIERDSILSLLKS